MSEYEYKYGTETPTLDEALTSGAGADYGAAAIEDFEAGGDPSVIAQTLRERVGQQHEARFVQYWHSTEAVPPEPMTAAEYVASQQAAARAAAAAVEAQKMLAARAADEQRASEHASMLAEQVQEFEKRAPALPKVAPFMGELLSSPAVSVPETVEETAALLDVSYATAKQMKAAHSRAQVRFEQQEFSRQREEAEGSFYGQAPSYKTLAEMVDEELAGIPDRQRIDGTSVLMPQTFADSVRETVAEWDAGEARFGDLDYVTGRKAEPPVQEESYWYDPDVPEEAFHAERERAKRDGWHV